MALRNLLGIKLPLIQAPMAGAQGSELAIAVSNAGGLGSLPCAMLGPDALREELSKIRANTTNPYNVNFFCHKKPATDAARERNWLNALSPYYEAFSLDSSAIQPGSARSPFSSDLADVLDEFRPPVVSFHFGLPSKELLSRVRKWNPIIMSSATTVEEALWLEDKGVDIIIAQGAEAGGHRGMFLSDIIETQVGLFALLPQIVSKVTVPVIAAGGIADSDGVSAAMRLGAAGVQIGTAFLLCPEATTSELHRRELKGARASQTALTNVFTGRPARGIINRAINELGPMSNLAPEFPSAATAIAPLRAAAEARGLVDFSPLWCGQNATGCREIPAAELVRALMPQDLL